MKLSSFALSILFMLGGSSLLSQQTRFEKTNGKESATYNEAIDFYKQLSKISPLVSVKTMGTTDAGFPLHLVLVNAHANFSIKQWDRKKNVVLLINNVEVFPPVYTLPFGTLTNTPDCGAVCHW